MEWTSVKIALPHGGKLVKVRKSLGFILSPVRLASTSDDCYADGRRFYWVYKSGLYGGSVDEADEWIKLDETNRKTMEI